MDNLPKLENYTILHQIGKGATATVYLIKDQDQQELALKWLLSEEELQDNIHAKEMFANEIRMSLQLKHENLMQAIEGKVMGDQAYLILEYFPDGNFLEQTEKGKIYSLEERYRILLGIAKALKYLHSQGAVHQDIKPQNIYVKEHRVVLGDLGASYMLGQGGRSGGSPFYMAPEIYRGEEGTVASDIYSFSVLCYEILSGQRPYKGESYEELMIEHMNSMPPSLNYLNPELPREISKIAQRGLSKDANSRSTIEDFINEFNSLLATKEPEEKIGRGSIEQITTTEEDLPLTTESKNVVKATINTVANAGHKVVQVGQQVGQQAGKVVQAINPFKKKK